VKPKRRWWLAITGLGGMVGVVGFGVFGQDPEDHRAWLVVLEQWDIKSKKPALFRLDTPKPTGVMLGKMATQSPSTGEEREAILRVAAEIQLLEVEAGRSTEFSVLPPTNEVWRLRGQVVYTSASVTRELPHRLKWCWQRKSPAPLREKVYFRTGTLESELITNSAPRPP